MARYTGAFTNWTPVAVADASSVMTDSGHHTIQGVASTRFELVEVYMGGLASTASPSNMVLGRTSTVGATLTAGRFASLEPHNNAPAAVPTSYAVSTTKPQRSTTLGMLLVLAFNAYGGAVRWLRSPEEVIGAFSNTASLGELSLNSFTGGTPGALSSKIIVDVL